MPNESPTGSWSSDESRRSLLEAEAVLKRGARSMWAGFAEFALRDNVLEVAVGLIIAASFTAVVNSLVSDILLPPLSLLPFMSRSMEEKFLLLKRGHGAIHRYNTRAQAIQDGAIILSYGAFADKVITFVANGLVLYFVAQIYGYFSKDSIIKQPYKCPFCGKPTSPKAKRCAMCTTWMDGREDRETSALTSQ